MKITPTVPELAVKGHPGMTQGNVYDVPEWLGRVLIGRGQAKEAKEADPERTRVPKSKSEAKRLAVQKSK